jgi:thiosulfate/3-mercaptopyruvate sulfurtransferase
MMCEGAGFEVKDLGKDVGPEAFVEAVKAFERAGALNRERVITYCGGGIAACSDALALTMLGVENVAVYDGSMAEWAADPQMPLETGASAT